jgi:anti-sigma regulatory factor (Ser/Thr protein kinase)
MNRLLEVVRDAQSAEDACARAMAGLVPSEGLDDDVAVVAVQSMAAPDELRLELPATPAVLSRTRHILRRWLKAKGVDDVTAAEVVIAVNEACANAIEHAYPPGPATFELSATEAGGELAIAVRDSGRWRESQDPARRGGARMMSAAMTDVQVNRTDRGTEVLMRRRLAPR